MARHSTFIIFFFKFIIFISVILYYIDKYKIIRATIMIKNKRKSSQKKKKKNQRKEKKGYTRIRLYNRIFCNTQEFV